MSKLKNEVASLPSDVETLLRYRILACGGANSQKGIRERSDKEIDQSLKRSKFAKLLVEMSDEQIRILTFALIYDAKVVEAVKCFESSFCNQTQLIALHRELEERNISLKR